MPLGAARRLALASLLIMAVSMASLVAGAGLGGTSERMAVVRGRSMEPLFHTGDLVFLRHPPPQDINVGDIVVYRWGSKFVIHRVVYAYLHGDTHCYVVWGDNRATNPIPDPGDPTLCGIVTVVDPATGEVVRASGIPYSWIVGVAITVKGMVLKIPYVGALALVAR